MSSILIRLQIGSAGVLALGLVCFSGFAEETAKVLPVKIAVFEFELDD